MVSVQVTGVEVNVIIARVDRVLVMVVKGAVTVMVVAGVTAVNVELIGWDSGADAA